MKLMSFLIKKTISYWKNIIKTWEVNWASYFKLKNIKKGEHEILKSKTIKNSVAYRENGKLASHLKI